MNKNFFSSFIGIIIAMLIGAAVLLLEGYNPLHTYHALFNYSLFNFYSFATTLKNSVPLILTGLSASIAFSSGIDNLGQPGQLVMGALFATIVGLIFNLPPIIMIPLLVLLSAIGGALWSGLAALLKRLFGMGEFIVTLMLNMIADFFTAWAITFPLMDINAYSPMTPQINQNGWLAEYGQFNTSSLFIPLMVLLAWFIFHRTKFGYECRIMGRNSLFARLGGCKTGKNYIKVMLITGALAGLAGGLVVLGGPHRFIKGIGANYAWDGIMIAIVSNNGIIATLLYGFFIGAFQTGAIGMELITNVPREFIQIMQSIILLVVVASREYLNILLERIHIRQQAREREA